MAQSGSSKDAFLGNRLFFFADDMTLDLQLIPSRNYPCRIVVMPQKTRDVGIRIYEVGVGVLRDDCLEVGRFAEDDFASIYRDPLPEIREAAHEEEVRIKLFYFKEEYPYTVRLYALYWALQIRMLVISVVPFQGKLTAEKRGHIVHLVTPQPDGPNGSTSGS